MIRNLPRHWGAFTFRLLLYQNPSEVCGHSTPQTLLGICEAHSLAVNRPRRLGIFPIISIKGLYLIVGARPTTLTMTCRGSLCNNIFLQIYLVRTENKWCWGATTYYTVNFSHLGPLRYDLTDTAGVLENKVLGMFSYPWLNILYVPLRNFGEGECYRIPLGNYCKAPFGTTTVYCIGVWILLPID